MIRTMFCSNCLTERCISIPRTGLKLDLSLGLHSLPLWSSSPLLLSRSDSSRYRWRTTTVSQAGQSGKSSATAVKSKNSVWRRDAVYSPEQPVEKVNDKKDKTAANTSRKHSTAADHAGEDSVFAKRPVSEKPLVSGRDYDRQSSSGYSHNRGSSSGSRGESFRRVSDNVSSYRNTTIHSTWVSDTWQNTHGGRQGSGRAYSNLTLKSSQRTSSVPQALELPVQGKNPQALSFASLTLAEMNGQVETLKRHNDEQNGGASTRRRKKKKYAPESEFRRNLDMCSKYGDLLYALDLYDQVVKEGTIKLDQYAYNVLLYLCSSAALGVLKAGKSGNEKGNGGAEAVTRSGSAMKVESVLVEQDLMDGDDVKHTWNLTEVTDEVKVTAQKRGFEIYKHMQAAGVTAGEPTLTSVARLAVAVEDGDLAFEVIKEMSTRNIAPKLRSYGPALFTYCKLRQVEKAFEVYAHMNHAGVQPEEDELRALLELSVDCGLEDKVYTILHRLRRTLRDLTPLTVEVFRRWFTAKGSDQVGRSNWDSLPTSQEIQQAIVAGGGGWHGLGWLGKGKWKTEIATVDKTGRCRCCSEQLITIDIDPRETENFAESLAKIALSREARADFKNFQVWLDSHGPYDAIVDAANVGLLNQNFSEGGFNFLQVNAVVKGIQKLSPEKRLPLILLHHKRTKGGAAATPTAQQFLQSWRRADTIFTTPTGSNDDWYWLYAAVKYKCLLVTNDEMRDHLFQLLGNDFFPKWKERHQVRFSISKKDEVEFHMPPPYSIVIQESETGAYHFPVSGGDDIATPREWLCVTRPGTLELEEKVEWPSTAKEDEVKGSLPPTDDLLHLSTELRTETTETTPEQSLLQAWEVKHTNVRDEGPLAASQVLTFESSSLTVESLESPSQQICVESVSVVAFEEQAEVQKSPKRAKSPRSPRSPRSGKKNQTEAGDQTEAGNDKAPKSPRAKRKSTSSPTLKLINAAEKKAAGPIDFQI